MKSNTISKIDIWLDENIFHGKRDRMFIECGANDGKKDSISYSFEKTYGWKGVLIEPLPQLMKKCMNVRSLDNVFINKALGNFDGYVELTVPDDNLDNSSIELSEAHIKQLKKDGFGKSYSKVKAEMIDIWTMLKYCPWRNFDLAIFDVEGYENNVLKSVMKYLDACFIDVMVVEYDWSDLDELISIVKDKYDVVKKFDHDIIFRRRIETMEMACDGGKIENEDEDCNINKIFGLFKMRKK